jgi:cytosine/adenosine deaminase-related metal-dependent hydrolase
MTFRKFQGDGVFTGHKMLPSNNVLICDGEGTVHEIIDEEEAGDEIQKLGGILTPGFINCHCHLELSHMRGLIPEATGLIDFVFSVVTQRHFSDEQIEEAISIAEREMAQNGIVATGDITNNLSTLEQKQKQNLQYYNFVEASGWLPVVAGERFTRSKIFFNSFLQSLPASIVPHAPYSVSNALWDLIKPFFQDKVVSIHNQETSFEDDLFLRNGGDLIRMYEMMKMDTSFFKASGKSSLQTYFHQLLGAAQIILVHNTFIKEPDIEFVEKARRDKSVYYCLCVNANNYIERALPPLDLLRKHNQSIVLGTDSLASNWSLSILDEMKTIHKNFPYIPLEELLAWSTINGAKALQMDDRFGSFEKGKQPGVVLLQDVERNGSVTKAQAKRLL